MKVWNVNIIAKLFSDKFFSATFLVFIGTGFLNFGNYLYHLLMGRMLPVASYGELQSIISIFYILVVPTMTMTFVLVKFVSSHKGRGENELIKNLYSYVLNKIILYGGFALFFLILIMPIIKNFLHLSSFSLALLIPIASFLNLLFFLNKSVLQGISSFLRFSIVNIIESIIKVPLAVIFVYLGFSVFGAFGAIFISIIAGVIISYLFVKSVVVLKLGAKVDYIKKKELLRFALPTFFTILGLTSLFTTDVILARHFFPGVESGYYSALSVLGKVIHFATLPIVLVLFPMVSETHARGKGYGEILSRALIVNILIGFGVVVIYFLIPNIMILLLFGEKYLVISPLLWIFGIFIALHSLCYLLANFYLSIQKTAGSLFVIFAAVLQVVLISIFHQDLSQIIIISVSVLLLLLISLLLYYPHVKNRT